VDEHTNLIEATATCIPRTAALVTHGGMSVSILRTCPVVKKIHTKIVYEKEKTKLFNHVTDTLKAGYQIAFIYPRVDSKDPRLSVEQAFELWNNMFPGLVVKLHGKMTENEKNHVIEGMKSGQYQLLISSTVIEIGLTLEKLKAVVVIDASRYGVSTLHQIRGRVARHGGAGGFYMYMPLAVKDNTIERLTLLEKHADGFALAEHDMEQRGFGDLGEDSEDQKGLAITLFKGIKIRPSDLAAFSESFDENLPL
jgi:ATP-dependent DNA helicase RecG